MAQYTGGANPTDYNMTGKAAPCLMGNWRDDRQLLKDGYPTVVYGNQATDSFERVMPNCRASDTMRGQVSHNCEEMTAVVRAPAKGKPQPQPRAAREQAEIEREAVAFVRASREPRVEFRERVSENHERYAFAGSEHYRTRHASHKGGHPSSVQLGPEVVPRKSAPPPAPSAGEAFGVAANADAYQHGWYGSDPVVSEFSARLKHVPGGPTSAAALTGVELSLQLLFARLVKRCRDAKLDLGLFLDALAKHAAAPEAAGAGAGAGALVPAKIVRGLAHAIKLPFPDGDLEAVIAACGAGRDEEIVVDLETLRRHIESVRI